LDAQPRVALIARNLVHLALQLKLESTARRRGQQRSANVAAHVAALGVQLLGQGVELRARGGPEHNGRVIFARNQPRDQMQRIVREAWERQ
jgi:hypothetical protein